MCNSIPYSTFLSQRLAKYANSSRTVKILLWLKVLAEIFSCDKRNVQGTEQARGLTPDPFGLPGNSANNTESTDSGFSCRLN